MSNGHEQTDSNPKGAGRPRKQVDKSVVQKLAEIQCTKEEIAYIVGVSVDTLRRNFSDVIDTGKAGGRVKLRRAMFRNAVEKDNVVMQIFLSKNLLGMSDNPSSSADEDKVLPFVDGAPELDIDSLLSDDNEGFGKPN